MNRDFTLAKYEDLCSAIVQSGYAVVSVKDYLSLSLLLQPREKVVILRHDMDKAKGNYGKAMKIFEEELGEFRKICDVKTICMHGNPISRWTNKDVWDKYDLNAFVLLGEPYFSIDYTNVVYLIDIDGISPLKRR